MNSSPPLPLSFWQTLRLLLAASRKRAEGRRRRQQEPLHQRSGQHATDWAGLANGFAILVMIGLNLAAVFVLTTAVRSGQRLDAERQGRVVVSQFFYQSVANGTPSQATYETESRQIAERDGTTPAAAEQKLRADVDGHRAALIPEEEASPGLHGLSASGSFAAMLGSMVLFAWCVMLVFQGEGLEVDLQRRRHPVWEWLFSHPVPPGAIFMAEMISPIAANPIYWGAPLFVAVLYGLVYGPMLGMLALPLMGVPVMAATACLGKALEIAVTLRFPPRSRGAVIGIMSWLGFISMMLFFLGLAIEPKAVAALAGLLRLLTVLPWPWLAWFLGMGAGGYSFPMGMLACWLLTGAIVAASVRFSVWGAQQGLAGNFAVDHARPAATGTTRFGKQPGYLKEPLYRKELLWFRRDRSAIVQTILIPLTVAALQAFNLRIVLKHAQDGWNYLCGAAILFGTYFLWILGPKSLASEGNALWIALTWPRGLESLLKAKAWLWSLISSGIVLLVLAYAVFVFPSDLTKIALVGIGWFIFSRSMAEKAVTLVTIASESGETPKIPWGRRGAAQLGMLTFSIGIVTAQWHLAIIGIVYSYVTAAAIWQNFRARLPFLYDPWSETLPPPPTLMHAMVSISLLIEGGAVVTGILSAMMGAQNIGAAMAMAYAICALIVSLGVASFLSGRGVSAQDVWYWQTKPSDSASQQPWWRGYGPSDGNFLPALLAGASCGILLGLFAHGYLWAIGHIPSIADLLRRSQQQMDQLPGLRVGYAVAAVCFAPFAEEYLFRGLLFRALDREWGGWRAVLGSAAFFAIYHPPLAWLPVGLLGVANALLFKKTRRLAPAVLLHMVYNAVVVTLN
jgi:membrane protease YdiL (CAAX protease family)